MDYERERRLAEAQAKQALAGGDWRMVAFHLYTAARMTLRLADRAEGRTRQSLAGLAERYRQRGDQARARAEAPGKRTGGASKPKEVQRTDEADQPQQAWVAADRPATRLADVAGMAEMKEIIQTHIILPVKHADVYAEYGIQPGTGVLMYGPPGTGKTFIAAAIAGELDAAFIPVEMRSVLSKWFGETEQLLADLFEIARSHARSVIFFDEAEALFPKRSGTNSSVMARVVPQLLQLINGVDPTTNTIILLGATNRPWLMDEAATRPGRFGRLVYIAPPDAPAREYMIRRAMRDTPTAGLDYAALATCTEGYSGADIAGPRDSVCIEAKLAALKRTVARREEPSGDDTTPDPVTMADFADALGRVKPSIQRRDLDQFERFRAEFARK